MSIRANMLGGLLASCIMGCLGLPDMSPDANSTVVPVRRLYFNDPAANDSLARALFNGGVKFVVQPGQGYALHVKLSTAGDRLAIYSSSNYGWISWKTLDAGQVNGEEIFNFQSNFSSAAVLSAVFLPVDTGAFTRLKKGLVHPWVRLLPDVAPAESHTLKVHLFLVGRLTNFPTVASKTSFAQTFLADFKTIFARYNITLSDNSTFEFVGDTAVRSGVSFSSSAPQTLPGTRVSGAAHLYLVDSISGAKAGETILGFAPREVLDLDKDLSSRVVLNASASDHTPAAIAATAAHELGHFFGLRHVWETTTDVANDSDLSNLDDGFPSTKTCAAQPLSKKGIAFPAAETSVEEGGYCLRIAGTAFTCGSSGCDPSAVKNLMFAYSCPNQDSLTSEQQIFERQNMTVLGEK